MSFYIIARVAADMTARSTNIQGIKEHLAAALEHFGDVREIQLHEILPLQLTFSDLPQRQLDDDPPEPPPTPKPQRTPRQQAPPFVPPTLEDVLAYCRERRALGKGMSDEQAEEWYDYQVSTGWIVGNKKMKEWKAAMRTAERKCREWERERHPELAAEAERERSLQQTREMHARFEQLRRALTNHELITKYKNAMAIQSKGGIKEYAAEIERRIDAGETPVGTIEEFILKYAESE